MSDREDHSFIGIYSLAAKGDCMWVDPSTDFDRDPEWSPDSERIAYLRGSAG